MTKLRLIDVTLGVIGGVCAAAGVITASKVKAEDDENIKESIFNEIESRYNLTPNDTEE